jgi:hypothetical protein
MRSVSAIPIDITTTGQRGILRHFSGNYFLFGEYGGPEPHG